MNPKSVAGIIFSLNRTSVLLIKRRDVPVWVLPGGGIEEGESSREAIQREILEETGFTVKVDRLVGKYYPINRLSKCTHLYECITLNGKEKTSSESKEVRFFSLSDLPRLPLPYLEWIHDAELMLPPIQKKLKSITYLALAKNFIAHPILVVRFILSRIGLAINSK